MKLWLISQTQNDGYDTYDSAVVAARTEDEARKISPSPYYVWLPEIERWGFKYSDGQVEVESGHSSWASHIDQVKVELLGEATPDTGPGVILASFNAG